MAQVIERIDLDRNEREAIENILMTMRDIIDNTSSWSIRGNILKK